MTTDFVFRAVSILTDGTGIAIMQQLRGEIVKSVLNGKHLVFSGLEAFDYWPIRNESGYIQGIKGLSSYTLPWLSEYFNFTYSPLQIPKVPLDPVGQKPGIITFITKGECDIAFSVSSTSARAALVDFTMPYLYIPVSYVIPTAESAVNFLAVVQPFNTLAWIGILLSVLIVLFFLSVFTWFPTCPDLINAEKVETPQIVRKITNYVIRILLKQGGYNPLSKTIPSLLVAGAWGLAVFLLTNYYITLLISFVAAPNPQPLIRSIYDLRNRPDLRLVTDKNINIDILLSTAESGFYKILGNKLKDFPRSRCTESKKCVEMVKSGRVVYTSGRDSFLLKAIHDDFKATGQCNLELSKENFVELGLSWALQKNNPNIPSLNYGLMRMREAGLLTHWYKQGLAGDHQCVRQRKQKEKLADISPLSLMALTGAFIVIVFGSVIGLLVLLGEFILAPKKHKDLTLEAM